MSHNVRNINDTVGLEQIMLDTMPICGNCWSDEYKLIACNEETVRLFGLTGKQEYLEQFYEFSPIYQPEGQLSSELAVKYVKAAFEKGYIRFHWMHQKRGGEPIPCEITLVRSRLEDKYVVAGYTRDLREENKALAKLREVDERNRIMLDATPLCANFWDRDFNNIDCNQEAVKLFELSNKQEYLDRFHELSPEYQPDGTLSSEKSSQYIKQAFTAGRCSFEWMHQKLNGELIPSEITLVRVKYKDDYIVAGYTRDLRELKQTLAKIREADERTQLMLDATPLCCNLWDQNFNNIDCNQEAVKLFDLKDKKEYLDRFFELSPEYQPCGRLTGEMAMENIKIAFQDGYCRFEWMHQKLNGEPVPSEITLVRVKYRDDYIVAGYTRDLRELKASMAKMREADERTQLMLDATPLCCNLWNKEFNNIDCNQEAVKLFELSSKQEYLERFYQLSPEYQPCGRTSQEISREYIITAFKEGYCRFEWMHQKLNGDPVPSEITLVRVKHRGDDIVAGYTRDLRELKAMLAEMHKVEADLRLTRDAAEDSAKAKSEFLANMSHEIRTPMNGILGLLRLMQSTQVTAKQQDYLDKMEQSAENLLRIINDILDFSKIEAGKLEMEYAEFSMQDILNEMDNTFAGTIKDKGLQFKIIEPDNLPEMIIGDSLRLKQVFINLINNAVKFTQRGSIQVNIAMQLMINKVKFTVTITDTGIGMTRQQADGLFKPFTQADNSVTRKYGGSGLGLAICKNLVEMMNGEIWVESEQGEGSAFHFTACFALPGLHQPVGRKDEPEVSVTSKEELAKERKRAERTPILLVEDNEINQMIACDLLEMQGYPVEVAANGEEAIAKVQAGNFALVLMDIQMPVLDGLSATKEIRKIVRFKELPIIAMSANAMAGDRERSLECGMNDHLTKPINPELVFKTIKKLTPNLE